MDIVNNVLMQAFAPATAAFALAAIGLNFHFGMTGLLNMGHAGFMLIGMYGYGITLREIGENGGAIGSLQVSPGVQVLAGLTVAFVLAILFGLLLGWPTLRLRGDYLAIVTIAAAEIIRYFGNSTSFADVTGGSQGILGPEYKGAFEALSPLPDEMVALGPFRLHGSRSNSWWLTLVAWSLVIIVGLLFWRLSRSPWGRVLKGIREDEDAVRSLGKSVYAYKMQALVLGGMIGALAGVVWAQQASIQATAVGRPQTFWIWTILLLGGAATVFGPALGSILLWMSYQLVTTLAGLLPDAVIDSNTESPILAQALIGVALMCLIIFRPQGIMGNKRELAISER